MLQNGMGFFPQHLREICTRTESLIQVRIYKNLIQFYDECTTSNWNSSSQLNTRKFLKQFFFLLMITYTVENFRLYFPVKGMHSKNCQTNSLKPPQVCVHTMKFLQVATFYSLFKRYQWLLRAKFKCSNLHLKPPSYCQIIFVTRHFVYLRS